MPLRIQCILFVSSDDNSIHNNYALLPQDFRDHPVCEIFLKNKIQILMNNQVSVSKNATYNIIEILLDEPEHHTPRAPRLYVCDHDVNIVKRLLSDGTFQIATRFKEAARSAITEETLKVIKKFATSKANIQYSHPKGGAFMHLAAKLGNIALINLLKKCKKSVNVVGIDNATPLHIAAEAGHTEACAVLLQLGAEIESEMSDGSTPLHLATVKGTLDVIQLFIEKNAFVEAKRQDGLTPLHIAVDKGHTNVIEYLLQHANVNSTINASINSPMEGAHPLHLAVKKIRVGIAKLLLSNGANVDAECANGASVLSLVVTGGYHEIVDYLLSQRPNIDSAANKTAFRLAFKKSKYRNKLIRSEKEPFTIIIKQMLAYGFDVGPDDVNEPDVLFGAIHKNLFETVEKLIDYGADVNIFHSFMGSKLSPLHLAVLSSQEEIIQLLLDHKADPNAKRGSFKLGETPLMVAVETGNLAAVKLLLAYNSRSVRDSPSLLLLALKEGNPNVSYWKRRIVELLLENGADVNFESSQQETPVKIVIKRDDIETAKLLMKFASPSNFENVLGDPKYSLVITNTLQAVLDYGFAKLNLTDRNSVKKLFSLYESGPVGESARILARHVVKTAAAYRVNYARKLIPSLYYETYDMLKFKKECKAEISCMKDVKIGETNITFYDVLSKGIRQVACYARIKDFVQTLEYHDTKRRFPIYGSIVECRIQYGVLRRKLLNAAIKIFKCLFPHFSALPDDIKEEIVDLLNNQDILILLKMKSS